jgi:hypothetical protein
MSIDIEISFIVRFLLVFIFSRAALHKVSNYQQFYTQLKAYHLLPVPLLPAFAIFLALIEAYLAVTLLVQGWLYPSFIAAALLALYALAMSINLVKGRIDLDCGCGGPSAFPQTISWALVNRNCVLVIFALATVLPVNSYQQSIQNIGTIVLASIAVIFIYGSIEQAIVNQQRQKQYFSLKANTNPGTLS